MDFLSELEKSPSGVETLYTGHEFLDAISPCVWRNRSNNQYHK